MFMRSASPRDPHPDEVPTKSPVQSRFATRGARLSSAQHAAAPPGYTDHRLERPTPPYVGRLSRATIVPAMTI
jgi:hypothetical protein